MSDVTKDNVFAFSPRIDFQIGHDVGYPEEHHIMLLLSNLNVAEMANLETFRNELVSYCHDCYRQGYVKGLKAGAEDVVRYMDDTGGVSISSDTISDAYHTVKDML